MTFYHTMSLDVALTKLGEGHSVVYQGPYQIDWCREADRLTRGRSRLLILLDCTLWVWVPPREWLAPRHDKRPEGA